MEATDDYGHDLAIGSYLWPPTWVGKAPYWEETGPQPLPDPALLAELVQERELPDGVSVRVFRDGLIAFRHVDAVGQDAFFEWHDKAVRLANAHLACLAAAIRTPIMSPSEIATPWSVMQVELETGRFRAASDYTSGGTRVALSGARQAPRVASVLDDWRFFRGRGPVSADQMARSFDLLESLLTLPSKDAALLRAEMLFRATSSIVRRDWAGALMSAWTASEGLVGDLFGRFLKDSASREGALDPLGNKHEFMEKDREKWLKGSDMTVRHTMEFLSLLDPLPFDLFLALNRCAKARNKWIHNEREPSGMDAQLAVRTLGEMFELVEDVPLHVLQAT